MTELADPNDKGLRILLEALTTISYLKGGDGRAACIAEYALDRYVKSIRNASAADRETEMQGFPGQHPEQRNHSSRRGIDRRHANGGPPVGEAERRLDADRRVNPDRRCNPLMSRQQALQ
jgi:hypothetical protein